MGPVFPKRRICDNNRHLFLLHSGFSVVNPGSNFSPKSLLGSSVLRKQDRSPDNHVQKKVRRLEPKQSHCHLKRFVAVSSSPTKKVTKQSCGSSRNRRKTDKSRTVCSVNQPRELTVLLAHFTFGLLSHGLSIDL